MTQLTNIIYVSQHMRTGIYTHSITGKQYRVLGTAKHSETLEEFVVYEALYKNPVSTLWIRPKTMFTEKVVIQGKKVPRFQFVKKYTE